MVRPLVKRATECGILILNDPIELEQKIDRIQKDIKTLRNNSKSRQEYLLQKYGHELEMEETTRARIIKAIMKVEARLEAYQTYINISGNSIQHHNINSIEVPASWPAQESNENETNLENPKTASDW